MGLVGVSGGMIAIARIVCYCVAWKAWGGSKGG